jgi:phosphatidylinositol dimannoside acyltransferase
MAESLRLKAVGAGYRAAWELTRAIPEGWAYKLADAIALRSWRRHGPRRALVEANLRGVVPPEKVTEVSREAFQRYARYWVETFRMQDLSRAELAARFKTEGIENIEKAHAAGTGAVLATMHFGNWDSGGRWVAERWPLTVVVEVLRPRKLFDRFVAHRRGLGMEIVPLVRGGDATKQCEEALRRGRLVALLADRDLSGRGVEVEMFGRRTKVPPGPAVLALRTGAPLLPAVIYLLPNGEWVASVMEALPVQGSADDRQAVEEITRRLAQRFEELVRRAPEQWYAMFLNYWLDA